MDETKTRLLEWIAPNMDWPDGFTFTAERASAAIDRSVETAREALSALVADGAIRVDNNTSMVWLLGRPASEPEPACADILGQRVVDPQLRRLDQGERSLRSIGAIHDNHLAEVSEVANALDRAANLWVNDALVQVDGDDPRDCLMMSASSLVLNWRVVRELGNSFMPAPIWHEMAQAVQAYFVETCQRWDAKAFLTANPRCMGECLILRAVGLSLRKVGERLAERGMLPRSGGRWASAQVTCLLKAEVAA